MPPDKLPEIGNDRVAFQQIMGEDHSIFSIQWVVLPPGIQHGLTSMKLLQLYLEYIKRFTLGIIRVVERESGIEFRLTGSSVVLICFSPLISGKSAYEEKTTLRISGGILVQPKECERGEFEFIVESVESGSRLVLKLSDYCPIILGSRQPSLWRKWLYRLTQAYLHKTVTIRFLALVYREITGERIKKGAVNIALRNGSDT